ncbi:hypothetical protein ABPG74_019637 [Tetrahymena malaccensis]
MIDAQHSKPSILNQNQHQRTDFQLSNHCLEQQWDGILFSSQNKSIQQREFIVQCSNLSQKSTSILLNRLQKIFYKIRFQKYFNVFLNLARSRMFRLLKPQQIHMINDKSFFSEENNNSNEQGLKGNAQNFKNKFYSYFCLFEKKQNILDYLGQKIPVFLPHSKYIEICFEELLSDIFFIQILFACQFLIFFDIFIVINTAIYVKGVLSTSRNAIYKNYKESFALYYDFISSLFPFIYYCIIQDQYQSRIALMLLLPIVFKYNDINTIINQMKDKFLLDKKAQNIIELVNLFKNILLISHIFACIWILAAKFSEPIYDLQYSGQANINNNPQTWIELMQLTKSSWVVQYIYSYYFITVTMITVGFGDVRPTNVIEVLVCIFLMMTCCVIFGFTINSIGQIFQDFYQVEKLIRQKRIIIGNYMIRKGVSKSTMKKIYEYLDYYWKEKNDENQFEEQEIIQQLSEGLREELLAESYRVIFRDNSIFKQNFSYDTLLKCLPFIQEQRCTPEEVIYDTELDDQDISIYFILHGELQVYIQSPNKSAKQKALSNSSIIYTLKKGDQFGEFSFFSGQQSKMSLKSLNFSKLMKIKRSDFLRVVSEDQTEYENFCKMKDTVILSKDRAILKMKCISCSDQNHDADECPYLHIYPNKGKVISSTFYSLPHLKREKPKQERALKLKKKSLVMIGNCCSCLLEYFNNKSEDLIQYEEKYLYLNSFQKYGSQQQNEGIQSQQQIDSNLKENLNNLNAASFPNNNLNSSTNILSSHTQSIQNIPQLNYQLSSFLKQKSNLNKQKSFKRSLSSKKSNSSLDESEEQKDNVNESCLESPKIKQNPGQNDRRPSCISLQLPQTSYFRTSSIQSQLYSENNQQTQQNIKQMQTYCINNNSSKLNTLSQKNDSQLSQKYLSYNYQPQQRLIKLFSIVPSSSFNDLLTKQTQLEISKIEFFQEQFDLFQGSFEKMKNMISYFPEFNVKNILFKIKKKQSKQNKLNNKSQNILNSKNLITKSQKKPGFIYSQKLFDGKQQKISFDNISQISSSKIRTTITNSNKFKTQSIFNNQSNFEKKNFLHHHSLIESKQLELSQNLEDFFTQENNNYSFSKMNPNTPSQSDQIIRNIQTIQSTQNRKSYDFQ